MPEFVFASERTQRKNQGEKTTPGAPSRCHLCMKPIQNGHDFNAITWNEPGRFLTEANLKEPRDRASVLFVTITPLGPECRKKMPRGSVFTHREAKALLAKYGVPEGDA